MTFFTIQQIRQANEEIGHHWFEPATMRGFSSRVSGPVIGGHFVSSERQSMSHPRLYTIRVVSAAGVVGTVGDFQGYTSKRAALAEIRRLTAS